MSLRNDLKLCSKPCFKDNVALYFPLILYFKILLASLSDLVLRESQPLKCPRTENRHVCTRCVCVRAWGGLGRAVKELKATMNSKRRSIATDTLAWFDTFASAATLVHAHWLRSHGPVRTLALHAIATHNSSDVHFEPTTMTASHTVSLWHNPGILHYTMSELSKSRCPCPLRHICANTILLISKWQCVKMCNVNENDGGPRCAAGKTAPT